MVQEGSSHPVPQPLPGLKGRVALVMGGTRGVGRAVAEKLVASGCDVLVNYATSTSAAQALVDDLAGEAGTVTAVQGDARRPATVERLFDTVRERHGHVDIVVHSVPSMHPMPAAAPRMKDFRTDVETALVPLAALAAPAAAAMGEGGRIVAVSASVARTVTPNFVSLGTAKAAMEALVRYLSVEFAGRGVTVNAVSASKLDKGAETTLPHVARALAARTPAGRLATPRDIADVVGLLCLPEAQWVQGQVITVDGGLQLTA
ncbi:SDR family oxidoreductase [Nucisporomicrobium flavum]|uniref:SDR family oxidoreductase n=1 Tax=Nucisporomicrobium flavum TaxID=2785915 RepID=UPI003C2C75F2